MPPRPDMKCAVLGVRMHSGWGALVAVCGAADRVEVIDRRRIVTADPVIPGAIQPYHHAASIGFPEAERYLADCAAVSERLALEVVGEVVRELEGLHYRIVGAAVLLASGRTLPSLSKIHDPGKDHRSALDQRSQKCGTCRLYNSGTACSMTGDWNRTER